MNLYLFWLLIEENYNSNEELQEFTQLCLGGTLFGLIFGFAPLLMAEHPLADDALALIVIMLAIGLARFLFRPLCAFWKVNN